MNEFWETAFVNHDKMWGDMPAESAIFAANYFNEHQIKNVLIPGVGYGRNAMPFLDLGMNVTGIEISKTAIALAKQMGIDFPIFHSSVADMPLNREKYDGIFSYALLHLLGEVDRHHFISACYEQLNDGGYMIFSTITEHAPMYGKGTFISEHYYELQPGLNMFFYNKQTIQNEFHLYGLLDIIDIVEPHTLAKDKPPFPFYLIICQKQSSK